MAKDNFKVSGMTVSDILNINPRSLAHWNERELSRALRTVSLAANKRINRLKQYAKRTKEGYVAKGSGAKIAVDALNWATRDGKSKKPFGVGSVDKRLTGERRAQAMREQIRDIRRFMGMQSSTIKGASDLRKRREKALFGKTAAQAGRGKSKSEKTAINKAYSAMYDKVWKYYYQFMELNSMDPHALWAGSEQVLEMIGHGIADGKTEEEIISGALNKMREMYEQNQEEYQKLFGDDWDNFGSFNWE